MPLVAHSQLPTFARLRDEGNEVLELDRALKQDIRELHVGLLNMMPDAALQATERQFIRLVGASNRIAQFFVHPFAVDTGVRGADAQSYIGSFYEDFDSLAAAGLDALIITGANPVQADLRDEAFWEPLLDVLAWAKENVCSVICSCLATHADLQVSHGIERLRLPEKRWGVYSHRVLDRTHPLVSEINTRFDAPHSHIYDVSLDRFREAGAVVLAESDEAGVHLAASPDGFRAVYFQGHPEYDANSLLKEYKREVGRVASGTRDHPPFPAHYFDEESRALLDSHRQEIDRAVGAAAELPPFPEAEIEMRVDNTWADTGKAIFNNWLGLVYQLTHADRRKLFMGGVDPDDPLGLRHDPARLRA
jgi:homoserine O-succinyltransferase